MAGLNGDVIKSPYSLFIGRLLLVEFVQAALQVKGVESLFGGFTFQFVLICLYGVPVHLYSPGRFGDGLFAENVFGFLHQKVLLK